MWLVHGTNIGAAAVVGSVDLAWQLLDGVGDYNGDCKSDLLWRYAEARRQGCIALSVALDCRL